MQQRIASLLKARGLCNTEFMQTSVADRVAAKAICFPVTLLKNTERKDAFEHIFINGCN